MPWKTTCQKEQRWLFLQEVLRHKTPINQLARRCGISRKTAYKWIARFMERGRAGLADRSRAANRIHNRPAKVWLYRVRRWKRQHPTWGAPKLCWSLRRRFGASGAPSEAAVSRWLKQWGLTRRRRRPPHKGPLMERPPLTKPNRPNDVWTVDFKGCFRTGDRTRVDPLTVRDLASRYALAVDLVDAQDVQSCRRSFERIFRREGLPAVIRVDNGAPFGATGALGLTPLSAWWVRLGIRVEFIAPGHPEQNGSHEQFHRVYKAETLQPPAWSLRAQKRRSQRWRQQYNEQRPHEALQMRVPAQIYRRSRRRMPAKLSQWNYDPAWQTRLVKGKGMISLEGRGRFIGEAFEGHRVGLKMSRPGVQEVYFGSLLIGELWASESTGIRAAWYRKGARRS